MQINQLALCFNIMSLFVTYISSLSILDESVISEAFVELALFVALLLPY